MHSRNIADAHKEYMTEDQQCKTKITQRTKVNKVDPEPENTPLFTHANTFSFLEA
jgi:hypothetical protein